MAMEQTLQSIDDSATYGLPQRGAWHERTIWREEAPAPPAGLRGQPGGGQIQQI